MARRPPCKPGKVRRRTASGRMMCLPKKKVAPKRKSAPRKPARPASGHKPAGKQLWMFNWVGGGFNTVRASSREEAIAKGNKMFPGYRVDPKSVGRPTAGELEAIYRAYD